MFFRNQGFTQLLWLWGLAGSRLLGFEGVGPLAFGVHALTIRVLRA